MLIEAGKFKVIGWGIGENDDREIFQLAIRP